MYLYIHWLKTTERRESLFNDGSMKVYVRVFIGYEWRFDEMM